MRPHPFVDSPFWQEGDDFDLGAMVDVLLDPDFQVDHKGLAEYVEEDPGLDFVANLVKLRGQVDGRQVA